ncbi:PTS sugar transporter subunit IIB [Streptococcus sp. ZJ93]|uniref:PTS sugar transporter subunit IIB n=1 Tax=Streptococcus handemini TaxID=3161188 RepID=UPI0032EF3347
MMKKQIMLACAAGMSTSLLVLKMRQAAEEKKLEVDILALPVTEAEEYVKHHSVDLILLGPQVAYQLKYLEELFAEKIPVAVIPMVDYGMMNGNNVIALAEGLMR